ncbi:MAG TPA: helix-turn-helix transcriptional regulator [Solirubrobacterales bacterium]
MLDKQELAKHFSRNLLRIRKEAGLSQEALGFLAGLHRTEIGMLERRIRLPRIDTLLKLAGGLEIEPGELLEGMRWRPGSSRVGHFRVGGEDSEPRP